MVNYMTRWAGLLLAMLLVACLQTNCQAAEETNSSGFISDKVRSDYKHPSRIPFPDSNPYTPAKAQLGRILFFDPILSGSRKISCSSCHNPSKSWADGLQHAVGEVPTGLKIRTPTLIDIAFVDVLGWDGKFPDLESVAFGPLMSPRNMNITERELLRRLRSAPRYVAAFTAAFGNSDITRTKIEKALATYERTIVAGKAPFDRWISGDETAITPEAKRGFAVFNGKAHCSQCHSGPSFTDGSFQDIGTATGTDIGRGRIFPNSEMLRYAFKTPTLRNVAKRAPYMHDGSIPTLGGVIELYNRGGINRPSRSPSIEPLLLTEAEKKALTEFLQTLTSDSPDVPLSGPPQ